MFYLFFRRRISELPQPIAVKRFQVINIWLNFVMQVQKLGTVP